MSCFGLPPINQARAATHFRERTSLSTNHVLFHSGSFARGEAEEREREGGWSDVQMAMELENIVANTVYIKARGGEPSGAAGNAVLLSR